MKNLKAKYQIQWKGGAKAAVRSTPKGVSSLIVKLANAGEKVLVRKVQLAA